MILVDANVLVYAVDRDSPLHSQARVWVERAFSGGEPIGLPWLVLLAFLRLVTRKGILKRPLAVGAALAFVDEWLELPTVLVVHPTAGHWRILSALLSEAGTAGNLTSDAHLAALAIEHGAKLCSADGDFRRFPGLTLIDLPSA